MQEGGWTEIDAGKGVITEMDGEEVGAPNHVFGWLPKQVSHYYRNSTKRMFLNPGRETGF